MLTNDINNLFCSEQIKSILSDIAKQNDFRMCLNKNVTNSFRYYFADIITLSFVVDILPDELKEIYIDKETYLSKKLSQKLNVKNIYKQKGKVEEYFNGILGNTQILFHGSNSSMTIENCVSNKKCINIELCKEIDNIYQKHNVYKAFQSGIKDFEENNFWVTTYPSSACFYAIQSPEFFARFASRSDYYKQDIFKYDRYAYYRKDFKACLRNVKKEIKEFKFSKTEKKFVIHDFKKLWENIVSKDFKNLIYYKAIEAKNIHHFNNDESLFDMLLSYFDKVHFIYDLDEFKDDADKIVLPNIKSYLKRKNPLINRKFIIRNGKRYFPDFYVTLKYSTKNYYTLKQENKNILKFIDKDATKNPMTTLIEIVNEAHPNSWQAKKFFKQKSLPSVSDVIDYYKEEFNSKVKELELEKNLSKQLNIIKTISEDVGLKYIICLKYNKFFKDVNAHSIYQYRKYLGAKLLEHYDGYVSFTKEKAVKLIDLYKKILNDTNFVLNTDVPLKIFNGEIEVIK